MGCRCWPDWCLLRRERYGRPVSGHLVMAGHLRTLLPLPLGEDCVSGFCTLLRSCSRCAVSLHQALMGSALREGEGLADIPERMVLVATELATNAIKYGRPPTVVRLLRSDEKFRPGRRRSRQADRSCPGRS